MHVFYTTCTASTHTGTLACTDRDTRHAMKRTVACASSYERADLSHSALLRMSATLMEPLLLLKANRLQWLG